MLVSLEAVEIGQMHGGDEDDRCLLKARMLADDFGELKPVDLGHAHIHQYDSNVDLEQLLQSVLGRRRLDQVLAQVGENGVIAEQFARLVVHHQNVYFFVHVHLISR